MAHQNFPPGHFTNAGPSAEQASRYSTTTPAAHQTHSNMAPPQNLQPSHSLYHEPQQAPHVLQAAPTPQASGEALEERILNLLYPYRDECFEDGMTASDDRLALVLCANLAFLMRHNQSSYGKPIDNNDVSIASRNWHATKLKMEDDVGVAGIGVFVNGGNGFTHTVVRIGVKKGENAVERLTAEVDRLMLQFFPAA